MYDDDFVRKEAALIAGEAGDTEDDTSSSSSSDHSTKGGTLDATAESSSSSTSLSSRRKSGKKIQKKSINGLYVACGSADSSIVKEGKSAAQSSKDKSNKLRFLVIALSVLLLACFIAVATGVHAYKRSRFASKNAMQEQELGIDEDTTKNSYDDAITPSISTSIATETKTKTESQSETESETETETSTISTISPYKALSNSDNKVFNSETSSSGVDALSELSEIINYIGTEMEEIGDAADILFDTSYKERVEEEPSASDAEQTHDEKKSYVWPELVGMTGEKAKAELESLYGTNKYNIVIHNEHDPTSRDFRYDRIRIFVDEDTKIVVIPPRVG